MHTSDLKSKSSSEEQEDEDQFSRLPDDVFILMLTKLHEQDFKFLFCCSLISKLFSSKIPLMPSVSISISISSKPTSNHSRSSMADDADHFIDLKRDCWASLQAQIRNALLFLEKFSNIRSLDVLFITDDDDGPFQSGFLPSLIDWKTKYDFKQQSFVFLFAQSVLRKPEQTDEAMVTTEQLEQRIYSSFHGVFDSFKWGNVMSSLLVQHPLLRKITVAGSKKGGRICIRDQEIVDFRNSLTPDDVSRIESGRFMIRQRMGVTLNMKSGYFPDLILPSSGYAMKGVSLVVVRAWRRLYDQGEDDDTCDDLDDTDFDHTDSDEDDEDDYIEYDDTDIINWDFDSDQEVFREAVTSILVDHKDKMNLETHHGSFF